MKISEVMELGFQATLTPDPFISREERDELEDEATQAENSLYSEYEERLGSIDNDPEFCSWLRGANRNERIAAVIGRILLKQAGLA